VLRALEISLVLVILGTALVAGLLWRLVRRVPAPEYALALGHGLASMCGLLGATFVKAAQYLTTRPDLISPHVIRGLRRVQDRVDPFPYPAVWRALSRGLGGVPEDLFQQLDPYPVASASVAQVHRGVLSSGEEVAVKVLRPGVRRQVALDLWLMRPLARILSWIPPLRMLCPVEVLDQFAHALSQQLDLRIEARNNRAFAGHFDGDETVAVPALVPELCSAEVLCMSFIRGERLNAMEPSPEQGEALARAGFGALLRMIFVNGLVHADLHPGNLLVQQERLVMLDMGLVCEVPLERRGQLMALIMAWLGGDPDAVTSAALALLDHAPDEEILEDPEGLRGDVAALMERHGDLRLAEISLGQVLLELLRLMRRHRLKVQPALTMVIVALVIVEGVGRQLAPGLDLLEETRKFFTSGAAISVMGD